MEVSDNIDQQHPRTHGSTEDTIKSEGGQKFRVIWGGQNFRFCAPDIAIITEDGRKAEWEFDGPDAHIKQRIQRNGPSP
jgi:hypothetical protein